MRQQLALGPSVRRERHVRLLRGAEASLANATGVRLARRVWLNRQEGTAARSLGLLNFVVLLEFVKKIHILDLLPIQPNLLEIVVAE